MPCTLRRCALRVGDPGEDLATGSRKARHQDATGRAPVAAREEIRLAEGSERRSRRLSHRMAWTVLMFRGGSQLTSIGLQLRLVYGRRRQALANERVRAEVQGWRD